MKKTAAAKFLLTPLREGRPRMLLTPLTRPLFLLTPLREGRPCGLRRLFVLRLDFYSRPCGRGDVPGTGEVLPALYFYSRPCGRGDPAGTPDAPQLGRLFLLTPLREGRRDPGKLSGRLRHISTHAPAGGATQKAAGHRPEIQISTHAPAGGATRSIRTALPLLTLFLLTPLREGRHAGQGANYWSVGISTHAPAGGATQRPYRSSLPTGHFYSRPCGRGDHTGAAECAAGGHFYSRPCGRGDCNFPQVRHEVLRQIAER